MSKPESINQTHELPEREQPSVGPRSADGKYDASEIDAANEEFARRMEEQAAADYARAQRIARK